MTLQEKILEYMRHETYKPLTAEDLVEGMGLVSEELTAFWDALKELEETASVIRTRHDKFGTPERMNLIVGTLSVSSKGFGFVIADSSGPEKEADVFIPLSMMMSAMHNDRVVARVNRPAGDGRAREGEIIRIVKRANQRIVGTFESSRSFGFVVPDEPKIGQDIFIPKRYFSGAKIGAKVVVEITQWPQSRRSAEGKIIEVLGMSGDPGVDILSVIKKYDLPMEFPPEVQEEARRVPEAITAEEIAGRRDRRDWPIVTIDGDDAKDLDDGIYVRRRGDGFFLGVYIADVSYYVKENMPLDMEAQMRGTSVYLVDRVLPMLPQRLSNGICSLNAGEDRLAMAAEMEIDAQGKIVQYEIFPAVIRVHRRLTYNIVKKILVDKDSALREDNADILEMLEESARLCGVLRRRRCQRGAIDFDLPEIKVKLDDAGKPVQLIKRERSLAESIIEECMLAANEIVAEHMFKKKLPFMYRIHEEPAGEKIDKLNTLLATFGLHINKPAEGEVIAPAVLQNILDKVAKKPEERIISAVMLRSMKQARYEAQNMGHFGLAAKYYTHFTSPIRRYPDLIVHRLLREAFADGTIAPKRQDRLKTLLPEIASYASLRERLATEAERETTDMKKIEYMAQFIGEAFDGIISGVMAFGLFVELENGVEGLVHVSSMENDYYQYAEEQYALLGERTRKSYRLGDSVRIVVLHANIEEKTLDFILEDNGTFVLTEAKKPRLALRAEEKKPPEKARKKSSGKAPEKSPAGKKKSGKPWYKSVEGKGTQPKKKDAARKKNRGGRAKKH